jgi:hypothetical protein
MAAQFKSNVRLREEKGLGSVSMKRLIFCGVGAVLAFMLLRFTPLASVALPALVVIFIALLILSGARGGLPLWQRLLLGWRGLLVLHAARHPRGWGAQIASALNLDPSIARLRSARLFTGRGSDTEADLGDWTLYADLKEAEGQRGLRLLERVLDDNTQT